MASKNSRSARVSPDFDDMINNIQKESEILLGVPIAKTKITKKIAERRLTFKELFGTPHKKGQIITDFMVYFIFLLMIVFFLFMMHKVWGDGYKPVMQEINAQYPTNVSNATINNIDQTAASWDFVLPLACIILTIGLLGSVFLLDTQPLFFIIMLILSIIFMILVPMIANTIIEMMDDPELVVQKAAFPITYKIVNAWPIYILISIVLTLVAFVAKSKFG